MISAITTCMGRREHLEYTLPFMLQEFDEVIVVDWSCPQHCGELAKSLGARVYYQAGEKVFDRCRARNYGALIAKGDVLCFVDADTICTPGTGKEIHSLIEPKAMVLSARMNDGFDLPNLFGFLAVPAVEFWNVDGYDESFTGWGHEDSHLRGKLSLEGGLSAKRLSGMALGAIAHSNALRGEFSEDPLPVSSARNWKKLVSYFQAYGISDWMSDPRTADITFRPRPDGQL